MVRRSTVAWALLAILVVLAAVPLGAAAAYGDRIVPGIRAAGLDLGGLTATRARERLDSAARTFAGAAVVVFGADRVWTATNADLDLVLDVEAAVRDGLRIGKTGDAIARIREIAVTVADGIDLGWPRRTSGAGLERFIEGIEGAVDRQPVDGAVTIGASGVEMRESAWGVAVDGAAVGQAILASRDLFPVVGLRIAPLAPELDDEATSEARDAAVAAFVPMRLTAGSEQITVPASRLAALVRIERAGGGLAARLDEAGLATLVDEVATSLDGPSRDAAIVPGSTLLAVVPGRDAVRVDRAAAAAEIATAIFRASPGERVVTLPAEIGAPAFPTGEAERIAAELRLAGTYTTYFPESVARATNIGLAARRFDGTVVLPGETFSFWGRIGEVSPATGYVMAGTILGGVSSEAIGGGLCQVSTTLFNAVIRAGLAVDERHPHSYYIERYPLGLDAAVLAPSADLVWTNDTAFPVRLFGASTPTSVTFWLYSAPNGRTVEFTAPLELNIRYPAPDQPADPAHAPGYIVPGRDVWTVRIVRSGETELWRDVWYSHYEPVWGGPAR